MGPVMRRRLSLSVLLALVVLVSPVALGVASAHDQLVSSDPAAGSTVAALPEDVSLTFSEAPVEMAGAAGNAITVTDPMGEVISAAGVDLEGTTMSTVLHPSMVMDGEYQVAFRVVSEDGHAVEGGFRFTVSRTAASGSSDATGGPTTGKATLVVSATGAGIPGGEGAAQGKAAGTFVVDLATSTLCYTILSQGLSGITAAHIHPASTTDLTIDDEIAIAVSNAGIDAGHEVCTPQRRIDLVRFASHPERFALMLHTKAFPEGAVAGTFAVQSSTIPAGSSSPSSSTDASLAAAHDHGGTTLPLALRIGIAVLVVVALVVTVTGLGRRSRRAHG